MEAVLGEGERNPEPGTAIDVLDMIVEQSSEAFHHVLDRVFELAVKHADADPSHAYCSWMTRPWIRSGKRHVPFLMKQRDRSTRRRRLAWYALMRCGDRDAFDLARQHVFPSGFKTIVLRDILMDLGITMAFQPLHADEPLFMVYATDPDRSAPLPAQPTYTDVVRQRDPTFNPPERLPHAYPFGGALDVTCGMCRQPLHRTIRLDPVPDVLSRVCSAKKLDLAACFSCSGWVEPIMYFCHDDAGEVTDPWSRRTRPAKPQWPSAPVVPTTVTLGRADARWNVLSPFHAN
ncbi:MAG TPA: hypothetical protein VGR35_17670 [Tepidisphaeraceae bacterium]|nr:hypothetical protein [Tepidisphaeraceae bacterium]